MRPTPSSPTSHPAHGRGHTSPAACFLARLVEYQARPLTGTTRAAVGLPQKLFHDFRRTAARDMVRAGVDRSVAITITGHRSFAVYERYNITATTDQQRALAALQTYRSAVPSQPQPAEIHAQPAGHRRASGECSMGVPRANFA